MFADAGEQAAFEAAEEAPPCPVCDGPMEVEYDFSKERFFCPECRARINNATNNYNT
jgi:formamidopyrimidine-DNA glycosylase